jgi:hypothetical protein
MKKFAGFTPEQQFRLLSKQGYTGPADEASMAKFLAASPAAASKMGEYAQIAQQRLAGKPMPSAPVAMADGGLMSNLLKTATQTIAPAVVSQAAPQPATLVPSAGGAGQLQQASIQDPLSVVAKAPVATVTATPESLIAEGAGQAGEVAKAPVATVEEAVTAEAPEAKPAATFQAETVTPGVEEAVSELKPAQGMVTEAGTVRGQLSELMKDFEGDGTPPWASGAMRSALSQMNARGLGASSMAGAAIVQAAMEAALPIASQDATTVAQFEMQNLSNEQQTSIFKTQQRIAGLFSDQAAQNAALQFNAASENQTNQFFADLQSTVSRFNAQQVNATLQFNAGQENAIEQFNAQQENLREQFNAQNSLIVAQANAQWRQTIDMTNTAAQNEATMTAVKAANGLTQTALDAIWQRERDLLAFAFQASENAADRDLQILIGDKSIAAQKSASRAQGWGSLAGQVIGSDWFAGLF